MVEQELKQLRKKLNQERAKIGKDRNPQKIRQLKTRIQAYQKLIREGRAA